MKRKLRLNRETLLTLEPQAVQGVQGGALTGYLTCFPSIVRTGCSCNISCGGTCQATCFSCDVICP